MQTLARFIRNITDFLYPPFRRLCTPEFFRYGVCGAGNLLLGTLVYFLFYNFVIGHELVYFTLFGREWCITPHIATLCIQFPVTLLTGFWLNRYVTFTESSVKGRKQFVRYVFIFAFNVAFNYFGIKLLVEFFHVYPTPSQMIISVASVAISYFYNKYFSFRK